LEDYNKDEISTTIAYVWKQYDSIKFNASLNCWQKLLTQSYLNS